MCLYGHLTGLLFHTFLVYAVQQPPVSVVDAPFFGKQPVVTTCSSCNHYGATVVQYEKGTCTYVAAGVLCLLGYVFFFVSVVNRAAYTGECFYA